MIDKDLLAYIKGKRYYLFLITLMGFCSLCCSVFTTFCLCYAVKGFIENDSTAWYWLLGGGLSALGFGVFFLLKAKLANDLSEFVCAKIRGDIYEKYLSLEGKSPLTPQQIAQLTSEGVEQLRLYYSSYLPSFFYAMLAPISLFVLFCFFSYPVALLYLACVPLIPVSIILVSKWAKRIFSTYWDRYLSLGGAYLDSVSGMKELLIFHYDEAMQEQMKESSEEFRKITMKVLVMQLFSTTIMDMVAFGGAGCGILLTLLYMDSGNISPYIALFMCLVGAEFFLPMRALGSAFHVAMNGASAGKKVLSLLNEPPLPEGKEELTQMGPIVIKGLSYSYPNGKQGALKDLNMKLDKGFYSLIGVSGSGKSTLGGILSKKLYGYEGSITVNGIELSDISSESLHRLVGYVSASSFLLNKSIADSFRFYDPDIGEDKMLSLLEGVSLRQRIEDAGGLSYIPKEGASDLSGGEKQRLLLAYNLSNPKPFSIFDEATSSIDKDSESIIVSKIKELSKVSTVLFISHRLQNALSSDMVYVLSDGKLIQKGTPEALKEKSGYFKKALSQEMLSEEVGK